MEKSIRQAAKNATEYGHSKAMAKIYRKHAKYLQDTIHINVVPKNKKLLKSLKVKKWIKHMNEVLEEQINTPEYKATIAQSVALGLPVCLFSDGHIELITPRTEKARRKDA